MSTKPTSERAFIDTNVFGYFFDTSDPRKQELAKNEVGTLLDTGRGVVSYQVIQEFSNIALRKFRKPPSVGSLQDFLDEILWPICEIMPSANLLTSAFSILSESGFSFYDSLIVAAAAEAECDVLLTEDMQVGRKIRGVEIRNPFA